MERIENMANVKHRALGRAPRPPAAQFPDGPAVQVAAYALRRRGHDGAGVHVAVVDDVVGRPGYFDGRAYDVEPLRPQGNTSTHGSAVAAAVLAVAPACRVVCHDVRAGAVAALSNIGDAQLVVCAWGIAPTPELDAMLSELAPRVLSVDADRRKVPGSHPRVRALSSDTPWPTGPFTFPGEQRTYQGVSMAVGVAAGAAALLIASGHSPEVAIRTVCDCAVAHLPDLLPQD